VQRVRENVRGEKKSEVFHATQQDRAQSRGFADKEKRGIKAPGRRSPHEYNRRGKRKKKETGI